MSQHTLSLFQHLLDNLPPFFPSEISDKMRHAHLQFVGQISVTPTAIEDVMIRFGYDLWPWHEAFGEYTKRTENVLGVKFFLAHLPDAHTTNYLKYRDYGLTWRDLYTGRAANYYNIDERNELVHSLIKTKNDLAEYARREVLGLEKKKYLNRVEEYRQILDDIKKSLGQLRAMADSETYHPTLAEEIRAWVRGFEMGLCRLGPTAYLDEVKRAIEFYLERKLHLNMMRGIDKPFESEINNN